MTPSGFSIGITLNTYSSLSKEASLQSESKNSSKPLTIQDPTVSPGCTLADIKTPFLLFTTSGNPCALIIKYSQFFSQIVEHKVFLVKIGKYLDSQKFKSFCSSE